MSIRLALARRAHEAARTHPRGPFTPNDETRHPMTTSHGNFTWFELVTSEIDDAKAFYTETLGWKTTEMDMGDFQYPMLVAGEAPQAGIVAPQQPGTPAHWISYLAVDDVDARVAKVTEHGGKVVVPPTDISVGRFALVADPQGALFNLFKGTSDEGGSTEFHWNELWAKDAEAVLPFYREVLGFEVETMKMPNGDYYVLKNADGGQGGIMTSPIEGVPPMWLPYAKTDDCDAAVARAKQHGGSVKNEANTIEGIGRIAIIGDRTGAVLGLITPAS